MHKLVFSHKVDMTHYKAGAVIFGCIDDRFSHLLARLIEHLKEEGKYDYVDRVVVAGGAKELGRETFLWRQIEASVLLHKTPTIVLTTHEDCGAMEWSTRRGSRDTQFLFHLEKHREIEREVLFRFPKFKGKTRHFYLSARGAIELDLSQERLSEEEVLALALDQ